MLSEKDKELLKKFLRKVPLFTNFPPENLDRIIQDFKIVTVKRGDDIVFQSDEGTDLYIVFKGKVKVSLVSPGGGEFILSTLNEGDFFGEMSLIDGRSRSASVVAEEDTALGILRRDRFLNTMKQAPVIAFDLLTSLVARLRKADDMIETLAFLDVNERLIRFIMRDALDNGEKDTRGNYRVKKRTHTELASHIGSSRESVSKALKVMSLKNGITESEGCFLVPPAVYEELEIT